MPAQAARWKAENSSEMESSEQPLLSAERQKAREGSSPSMLPLRSCPEAQPLPRSAAKAEGPWHVPGDCSGFLGPCCQLCAALNPSRRGR